MTQALIRALALPPLYARTARAFWDDEHISAQMLKAHLAPDVEAASRRHEFIERSARWIAQLLPPERYPALTDFGCGPGLYAERFARAGYRVTGIDCSRRSIDYARRSAAAQGLDIAYIRADYLHLDAPVACDAATLIYCDYGALTPEERTTLLHVMRRCLRPGGRTAGGRVHARGVRALSAAPKLAVLPRRRVLERTGLCGAGALRPVRRQRDARPVRYTHRRQRGRVLHMEYVLHARRAAR